MHLSLWLDSPMFWAPWHQSMSTYSQPSFSSSTWKRGGVWMCKLRAISEERLKIEVKLLLSAKTKSYKPRRLAQQRVTLTDCSHHLHHGLSLWQLSFLYLLTYQLSAKWLVGKIICTMTYNPTITSNHTNMGSCSIWMLCSINKPLNQTRPVSYTHLTLPTNREV